jgi:membrane-associated PAP2 superfamily phosphatase
MTNRKPARPPYGLLALLLVFGAAMVALPAVDRSWTESLIRQREEGFVQVMRRTVFEDDALGGSDIPVLLLALGMGAYVWSGRAAAGRRAVRLRPALGYVVVGALVGALGPVQALKWVMGRARPMVVLGPEHLPYTDWYTFGAHYVTDGLYWGSFPSGHTAAAFIPMAAVYALLGDPSVPRLGRAAGWALGVLTLGFTAAMAVASAMTRNHWISDAVGVTGLVWLLLHGFYFRVLRVPEQRSWVARAGRPLPLPRLWEARLCLHGLAALAGLTALGIGARAPMLQHPPWLALLMPPGLAMAWWFFRRATRLLRRLHSVLDEVG